MTYPAFDDLDNDPQVTPARWWVYRALRLHALDFVQPRPVKLEWLARRASVHVGTASKALVWLIDHGYLIEHGRDARGMKTLTLAYARQRRDAA